MIETPETQVRRILIGYDGSDGARDAVALAAVFGGGFTQEALLVNVLPYPGPLPVSYRLLGYDESPAWKAFFQAPEAILGGVEARHRTYTGSPAKVMTDIAEEEEFDLIVVGSPHRGPVGRALMGSVALGLLHGATVPTVVAPHGYAEKHHDSFHKIAVAYDGSPEAAAAIARAGALIAATDGEIEILTVATPPIAPTGPFAGPLPSPMPEPEKVLTKGIEMVASGVAVHGRELHGKAAHELATACEDVDLLVVGSRGYGPFARVMLGSVSTELIHLAPCPVLVATRPLPAVDGTSERDGSESVRAAALAGGVH